MKQPISFILDLILDYDLPEAAQKACRKYVRELEKDMQVKPIVAYGNINGGNGGRGNFGQSVQAPSTEAALARQAQELVAATPAAANAIAQRQSAIAQSMSGKPEPGRTSPRKF